MDELQYQTREGDRLDQICFKRYGSIAGQVVESVYAANPGLADYGPVLPAGLVITLPVLQLAVQVRGIKLWD